MVSSVSTPAFHSSVTQFLTRIRTMEEPLQFLGKVKTSRKGSRQSTKRRALLKSNYCNNKLDSLNITIKKFDVPSFVLTNKVCTERWTLEYTQFEGKTIISSFCCRFPVRDCHRRLSVFPLWRS